MVSDKEETKKPKMSDKTVMDVINKMTNEQKKVLFYLVGEAAKGSEGRLSMAAIKHFKFTKEQKTVLYYLLGEASKGADDEGSLDA